MAKFVRRRVLYPLLQGGGIISQVRDRTGAKVHMCDAEPGRPDRVITISLIDGVRCTP